MNTVRIVAGDTFKQVTARSGENLLQLIRKNGFFIDAPCNGQGVCKKCYVFVNGKSVCSCQVVVQKDIEVVLGEYCLPKRGRLGSFSLEREKLSGVVIRAEVSIVSSQRSSYISDMEYIKGLLKDKGYTINRNPDVDILNEISCIAHNDCLMTVFLLVTERGYEIIDVCQGQGETVWAVAVDLGTTTLTVALVDMEKGTVHSTISFYNPQIVYGADVIHRIIFSLKNEGALLLKDSLCDSITQAMDTLAKGCGISLEAVKAVAIAGNTTMIHLFLGLSSRYIREFPFSPVVSSFSVMNAGVYFGPRMKKARMFIAPCPANYLGGDVIAGIVASQIHKKTAINIFLDIGTNAELVIGNSEWLLGCACSAGPAFEGMGLNCGTRYREGAITEVFYDQGKWKYSTVGNKNPCGISGSGAVSIIAQLYQAGMIDNKGKFKEKIESTIRDKKALIFYQEGNNAVFINEVDIDNVLRAKAAIHSGIQFLLRKVGVESVQVEKLFIAGNFGVSLPLEASKSIGLLPNLTNDKIVSLGDAALEGMIYYLLSASARQQIDQVAKMLTYIDLSNEPSYMDEFMAAYFIPA